MIYSELTLQLIIAFVRAYNQMGLGKYMTRRKEMINTRVYRLSTTTPGASFSFQI